MFKKNIALVAIFALLQLSNSPDLKNVSIYTMGNINMEEQVSNEGATDGELAPVFNPEDDPNLENPIDDDGEIPPDDEEIPEIPEEPENPEPENPDGTPDTVDTSGHITTEVELIDALTAAEADKVITIGNDIYLTQDIAFTLPASAQNNISFVSGKADGEAVRIYSNPNSVVRHLNITLNPSAFLTMSFDNVVLDGGGVSGGITVNDTLSNPVGNVELINPVIENCYNDKRYFVTSSVKDYGGGGAIRISSYLTIDGGSFSGNKSVGSGGAILAFGGITLEGNVKIFKNEGTFANSYDAGGNALFSQGAITIANGSDIEMYENISPASSGVYSYGVIRSNDGYANLTVNGKLTIRNNDSSGIASINGQNIYVNSNGELYVKENKAMGVSAAYKNLNLTSYTENVHISDNGTIGLYTYGDDIVTRGNITVSGNGSIGLRGGRSVLIYDTPIITGNGNDTVDGGGIRSYLGVYIYGNPIITNNTGKNGGGIYVMAASAGTVGLEITGSPIISGNTAINGGGIYMNRTQLNPTPFKFGSKKVEISGNTATENGGGIYLSTTGTHPSNLPSNVFITDNHAELEGGGVFIRNGYANLHEATGLNYLYVNGTIFSGNTAGFYRDEEKIAVSDINRHGTNIRNSTFSLNPDTNEPFLYGYNNYDINYNHKLLIRYVFSNGQQDAIQALYPGDVLVEPEEITRPGHSFRGWHTDNEPWTVDNELYYEIGAIDNLDELETELEAKLLAVDEKHRSTLEMYRQVIAENPARVAELKENISTYTANIEDLKVARQKAIDDGEPQSVINGIDSKIWNDEYMLEMYVSDLNYYENYLVAEYEHVLEETLTKIEDEKAIVRSFHQSKLDSLVYGRNSWNFQNKLTLGQDVTLYAKWAEPMHNVTFLLNGGTSEDPLLIKEKQGSLITKTPSVIKLDHGFDAWYKDEELTEKWDFSSDIVTADVTLYAHWIKLRASNFTVKFDANGGVLEGPSELSVKADSKIENPPTATKEGFNFTGWKYNPITKALWDLDRPVESDLILVAQWSEKGSTGESGNNESNNGNNSGNNESNGGSNGSMTPEEPTTELKEDDIPLGIPSLPSSEPSAEIPEDEFIDLDDEDVPLSNAEIPKENDKKNPKTGVLDNHKLTLFASLLGIVILTKRKLIK